MRPSPSDPSVQFVLKARLSSAGDGGGLEGNYTSSTKVSGEVLDEPVSGRRILSKFHRERAQWALPVLGSFLSPSRWSPASSVAHLSIYGF